MPLPERKSLPHLVPSWLRDDAMFFVTVCYEPRGVNQLCTAETAKAVFESLLFRNSQGVWRASLCVLMPDHLHLLVSFPHDASMKKTLSVWKGYLTKTCGICWQRDFFDHRLRDNENYRAKAAYIRENPVRKGLCEKAEDWPFSWSAESVPQ